MLSLDIMAKRKKIPLAGTPPYPSNEEIKDYAHTYKDTFLPLKDCHINYHRFQHSQSVDVLCTWGCNGIFFVFAYPPAGFLIAKPQDVLQLQTFEGWILQYQAQGDLFNLLVKASRDGVAYFWTAHKNYKKA